MNAISRFIGGFFERKASTVGPLITGSNLGRAVWSKNDYESFAREAYVRNVIAHRCVQLIAQNAASVRPAVKVKKRIVEDHNSLSLLERPAPNRSRQWLVEHSVSYRLLSGTSYIEGVGPTSRHAEYTELWPLRPDRMKVVPGKMGLPSRFEYRTSFGKKVFEANPVTGESDILHMKRFHPTDDWYGLSAVEVASYAIDRHNEASAHNMAVLQNSATPSGALVLKPTKGGDGGEVQAPGKIIEAAESALRKRHTGSRNAGKPMVLGGNVDWVRFGFSMEELQLIQSKIDAARDICTGFGVPIELIVPGESTYNNKREAKLALYEETVLPIVEDEYASYAAWLSQRAGSDFFIEPDYDKVDALSLRREIRQKNTLEAFEGGLIDRDQALEMIGLEGDADLLQRKIDSGTLTGLINATKEDQSFLLPLYRYMRHVGLIPRDMDFAAYLTESARLIDEFSGSEEEEEPEEEEENEEDGEGADA